MDSTGFSCCGSGWGGGPSRAGWRPPPPPLTGPRDSAGDIETGLEPGPTRSEREDRFLTFLDAHGLPRPAVNATIETFEVDFAWPDARLIVELDGHAFHSHRHAFERDASSA